MIAYVTVPQLRATRKPLIFDFQRSYAYLTVTHSNLQWLACLANASRFTAEVGLSLYLSGCLSSRVVFLYYNIVPSKQPFVNRLWS